MDFKSKKLELFIKILVCAIWLPTGVFQIFHFDNAVQQIADHHIPLAEVVAVLVILMKVGGTVLVLMNKWVKEVLLFWASFVLVATVVFHYGMYVDGKMVTFHFVQFMKNLAIAGGLIAFALLLLERESTEQS